MKFLISFIFFLSCAFLAQGQDRTLLHIKADLALECDPVTKNIYSDSRGFPYQVKTHFYFEPNKLTIWFWDEYGTKHEHIQEVHTYNYTFINKDKVETDIGQAVSLDIYSYETTLGTYRVVYDPNKLVGLTIVDVNEKGCSTFIQSKDYNIDLNKLKSGN